MLTCLSTIRSNLRQLPCHVGNQFDFSLAITPRHHIWGVFIQPFVLVFYPAIFATFLIYGIMIIWIAVFTVVNSEIFNTLLYNFRALQTGLISISPLIFLVIR
jgi:hypothetical protein